MIWRDKKRDRELERERDGDRKRERGRKREREIKRDTEEHELLQKVSASLICAILMARRTIFC